MRSVRIAATAGIVAAGLALGAAGIAQAAPASAPAPVAPKTVQAAPAKPAPTTDAQLKLKAAQAAQLRAKAVSSAEAAKRKAAHQAPRKAVTRANYRVTASRLNVRSGPSVHDRRVGSLAHGAHVTANTAVVNGFRELSAGHWVSVHYLAPVR